MYKSEKQLVEENLLIFILSVIALESVKDQKLASPLKKQFLENCKDKSFKISRRCGRLVADLEIVDKQNGMINGHKLILTIHSLAELLAEKGQLKEFMIELFEPFLEIENRQQMDEKEWFVLKNSAEKQAIKLLNKLQKLGYYGKLFF